MSLDCAKKYAEGKINDILNQAIIDAYSAGYNVGYQDGYKKAEKETIQEEMKYVDLGLPSGTLWASDYIKKDGEVLFLPYRDAIDEFNLPTDEQIDELKDYCEISLVEDNGIKTYICLGPSGKTISFTPHGYQTPSENYDMDNAYFWTNDNDKLIESSKRTAKIYNQGSLTTAFLFPGYKIPIRTVKK
jgi:hypothetical protein